MNRIPVHPDHREAFEERFSDRAALVDGMDGFVAFLGHPKVEVMEIIQEAVAGRVLAEVD
jgi:heme-degrading monooxygenase HmoA